MISSIVSAFDALTRDGANLTEKSFVQITRLDYSKYQLHKLTKQAIK